MRVCAACGGRNMEEFYRQAAVPVHSVLLFPTRARARRCPRGQIRLGACQDCGLVTNLDFDPHLLDYGEQYEENQGYSPTFDAFHRDLAAAWIRRYGLHGKRLLEIGCGKGEFLSLLCESGGNRGLGFDPAFTRARSRARGEVEFVRELYSSANAAQDVDFVCCKMTLEHVHRPTELLDALRSGIAENTSVVFQVPNAARIFDEGAFWDIYYEHCHYFSRRALEALFHGCGFALDAVETAYQDQYLFVHARSRSAAPSAAGSGRTPVAEMASALEGKLAQWRAWFQESGTQRIVLWGGGSKAVALLSALTVPDRVHCVVDINPHRQQTFLPPAGHKIVAPQDLPGIDPQIVVVMNPVYEAEIRQALAALGLTPRLVMMR